MQADYPEQVALKTSKETGSEEEDLPALVNDLASAETDFVSRKNIVAMVSPTERPFVNLTFAFHTQFLHIFDYKLCEYRMQGREEVSKEINDFLSFQYGLSEYLLFSPERTVEDQISTEDQKNFIMSAMRTAAQSSEW